MAHSTTRRSHAERRKQISEAALSIIATEGATSLTTKTLAAAVGVSTGALFRHFESLDAVLTEATVRAITHVDATFPDGPLAPVEALRTLAIARIGLLNRRPGIAWLLRSSQAPLVLPEEAVLRLRELVKRSRQFIRRALRRGMRDGSFRSDVSLDVLMMAFTSTVHALVRRPSMHGKRAKNPARSIDGLMALLTPIPRDSDPRNRSRSSR